MATGKGKKPGSDGEKHVRVLTAVVGSGDNRLNTASVLEKAQQDRAKQQGGR